MIYNPEDFPPVIYKYRDCANPKHKSILENNKVYFSSPKDLNDPFDCRVPITFELLDTDKKKKLYALKVLERHKPRLIKEGKNLDMELAIIESVIFSDFEKYKNDHNEHFSDAHDIHIGILSLSKKWDVNLLWSHYSNSHQGFCVGFSPINIMNSGLNMSGDDITYFKKDKFPTIDPFQDDMTTAYERLFLKSDDWKYEDEYRLTKVFFPNVPTNADRVITLPDNCITEVVLGHKISPENESEIIDLARKKNIKVYKTFIESGKMGIRGRHEIL